MVVKTEILQNPTEADLEQINALLPQIAQTPHLLSLTELQSIVAQKNNCKVVVARIERGDEHPIVGVALVTLVDILTGRIAMVEDVVVDSDFRRVGIGETLNQRLIMIASEAGAKHISLYTNRGRFYANAMYKKLKYELKDALNFYRMNLVRPIASTPEEIAEALLRRVKP